MINVSNNRLLLVEVLKFEYIHECDFRCSK